jgi:hypothetical protein
MRIWCILRILYHSFIQDPIPFYPYFSAKFVKIAPRDPIFEKRILDHQLHRNYKGFSYKALH